MLRQPRRRGDAGLRQGPDPGARISRQGQGADQQGRLPRPLRRRAGARRLSRGGLVHVRRTAPTSTRSSIGTSSTARSSRGFAFDAESRPSADDRRPAGALEIAQNIPATRAPRHRARRASASAAGRHARQQGRADARQDVLRAGLRRRPLQFPRRRPSEGTFDDGEGEAADALAALSLRAGALRRRGARAAGRARRLFVRRVRADDRRAIGRRASGWCSWVPPCAASPRRRSRPTPSSSTARRTRSCRLPEVFAWARPQALPSSCSPDAAISSTAGCCSCKRTITGMWHWASRGLRGA